MLALLVQVGAPDTLHIRVIPSLPPTASSLAPDAMSAPGSAAGPPLLGPPSVRISTGQGLAEVWLQRSADSVALTAWIPDTSYYWGDDFVVSLDLGRERGSAPQDDDFQWYLRRMLDSSVVYRGRGGRWVAPRGDPDWRLGKERSGAGWAVDSRSDRTGWHLSLRMDAAFFRGQGGFPAAIGFRIYDDAPSGWFAWPSVSGGAVATLVERTPALWVPVR